MTLVLRKLFAPCTSWGTIRSGSPEIVTACFTAGLCCVLGNIIYMKGRWNSCRLHEQELLLQLLAGERDFCPFHSILDHL